MKMSELEEKLREKHLKITPQRLEILRAVQQLHNHPSADSVYQNVKKRYPAVSLATVYKTLETLVEIGEIRVALVSRGKTLYDIRLDRHHHAVCSVCGHVEDIEVGLDCLETCFPRAMRDKFRIMGNEVIFYGVCPSCDGNSSPSSSSETPPSH